VFPSKSGTPTHADENRLEQEIRSETGRGGKVQVTVEPSRPLACLTRNAAGEPISVAEDHAPRMILESIPGFRRRRFEMGATTIKMK
jgi:hypothetical protein